MQWTGRFWIRVGLIVSAISGISYYSSVHTQLLSFVSYPAIAAHACIVSPISQWIAHRKTNQELTHTVATLQKKCTILERSLARFHAQRAYLQGSKELHAFNRRFNMQGRVSKILAKSFADTEQFFLIDAGTRDGVQKDAIVLYNSAVVGKVTEVFPLYSKVCLITDAQCKMGAYAARDRAQGIHEGRNLSEKTELTFVDHLSDISEGDIVLTNGNGLVFPEGYTLGTVSKVAPDGLYKQVSVTPACDFERIEYCMIVPK